MSEVYTESIDKGETGASRIISEIFSDPTNEKRDEEAGSLHCQMHQLNQNTDPFATRAGRTLTWRGINMTLVSMRILVFPPTRNVTCLSH